jgi:(4-(4-[2-(gamma-L-glutamylamino)ethyl]phenoxymethyl)furan-2-yl)methanamine synthase
MAFSVLGVDVGGANLKAAHSSGTSTLVPFALWKNPAGLAPALAELFRQGQDVELLAVTMTGELCDCFETKRQGVHFILQAIASAGRSLPVRIWLDDGTFASLEDAHARPLSAAATNWLALATFAGRLAPSGPAVLIDIGSTTSDIVPLQDGRPVPRGRTDPDRLRCQELVYSGVRRTPVCALLGADGAAEVFATTLDVNLILGQIAEELASHDTADGRPATIPHAYARLARMLCADTETCPRQRVDELARDLSARQQSILSDALRRVAETLASAPISIIVAGAGEFLAEKTIAASPFRAVRQVSLAEKLGPEISQAACAYALAILAQEQLEHDPATDPC